MDIIFQPIGMIHSPFTKPEGMPIQPASNASQPGQVEVYPQFTAGLKDLDGFSHIILLYHLHKVKTTKLQVIPFLDETVRGVFATRAPTRPNPIGLSVVKLNKIATNVLYVENIDVLDGTPLLDIKPYIPDFDAVETITTGWLDKRKGDVVKTRSDQRFLS